MFENSLDVFFNVDVLPSGVSLITLSPVYNQYIDSNTDKRLNFKLPNIY